MQALSDRTNISRWLVAAFVGGACIYGVARAIRLSWVCDDAFISFRYAWNLARGKGLVFNAGEYVEGFTNLFWTLLISPFFLLDAEIDVTTVAIALGIVCYTAMLVEFFREGRCAFAEKNDASDGGSRWRAWPWTLPALAAHQHLHIFASSGLETALFILLITTGVLRASRLLTGEPQVSRARGAFVLLSLACLTRPDGLLVYGITGAFVARADWRDGAQSRKFLRFRHWFRQQLRRHSFFSLSVGASFVFRLVYYGDWLPNTFYAKSAHDPYFAQGLVYAGLYFAAYWVCIALLLSLIAGAFRQPQKLALIATITCAWTAYVAWVGGDFMFGRFLVPITPLIYFGGESALRSFLREKITSARSRWWLPALLVLVATVSRYDPYEARPLPVIAYVGEEHKIYTKTGMRQLKSTALATRATMQAADPVVAFVGAQAALIFYWDISTAIEAQTGLTDRKIARMPLEERGWIGHEKSAPIAYLRERDVAFILRPPPEDRRTTARVLAIEGLIGEFEIVDDQPEVMEILRRDSRFRIAPRK